ncbi:MAG: thiol reductant ABC exporter subunit CydC [Acidimicrobiales bacterium]
MSASGPQARSSWSSLREIMRIGAPPRGRFWLSTGLGSAAAMSTVALMACSGALIDKAALRVPLYTLTVLMAAVQIFALSRGPLRYGERLLSHDSALRVLGRLRAWIFDAVEPLCPAGLRQWRSGDLLFRATGDVETLQDLYVRGVAPLVVAALSSAASVALLTIILPAAGLVLGGCLAAAFVLTSTIAWARHHRLGSAEAALHGQLAADIVELVQGAPDLIAFGREDAYIRQVLAADESLTGIARRRSWTAGAISAVTMCLTGAAVCVTLLLAISSVGSHRLAPFMLAVVPLVALASFEVVIPMAEAVSRLAHQAAAADRLLAIADLPAPVDDPISPAPAPTHTNIELEEARLRYGQDGPWVLDGLSMSLGAGSHVALTGASGAGKSSVVNALLRFWSLEGGEASLGGAPLRSLSQDTTRRLIGWVSQDTHLFNASIRANIALARPDASEEQIVAAAQTAQLGPWIDSLPQGLDTSVGEMGTRLSGGQRQRVALARALLADTPILLLDEPTAGLDRVTASRLLHDMLATASGKSILYITHRVEETTGFDTVVELRSGRSRSIPEAAQCLVENLVSPQ